MTESKPTEDAASEGTASSARPGDEMLPFLNNFHDIFTTIGVLILFTGLILGAVQFHDSLDLARDGVASELVSLGLLGLIALIAWGLSALLVGRQRRILPGIVLCAVFVFCFGGLLVWLYTSFILPLLTEVDPAVAFDHLSVFQEETVSAMLNELGWALRSWPVMIGAFGRFVLCQLPLAVLRRASGRGDRGAGREHLAGDRSLQLHGLQPARQPVDGAWAVSGRNRL